MVHGDDITLVQSISNNANSIVNGVANSGSTALGLIGANTDMPVGSLSALVGNIGTMLWSDLANIIVALTGLRIGDHPTFIQRNYGYMARLMLINHVQRNAILGAQGNDAESTFGEITANAHIPLYASQSNYLNHARNVYRDEYDGIDTPRHQVAVGAHGSPYMDTENLYYDESGVGTFANKIRPGNMQSIVSKTDRLFRTKKIKSLISAFGTSTDGNGDAANFEGSQATKYGLSIGRSLLKKGAEDGNGTYMINGYNNPFCRAWTHHYQYDRYNKAMRPFMEGDEDESEPITPSKFHDWSGDGKNEKWTTEEKVFGWKNNNPGWKSSVLNKDTGLLNIAPSYNPGCSSTNIPTKNVMFSIENLAWKDYSPFDFENCLSWEQRGPMGGRIMWFPPYGLSFNETTRAEWTPNTFIGRGEDVFTYTKTQRSGTLRFMMVVDHPSILDYATWSESSRAKMKDSDVHRFIAGCDAGKYTGSDKDYSIVNYAVPTPLTDEFIELTEVEETGETIAKEKKIPETPPTKTESVSFYVFFPNNYTGAWDTADFAIGYLLAGRNAQMIPQLSNDGNNAIGFTDEPISFKNFDAADNVTGNGYEMQTSFGLTDLTYNDYIHIRKTKQTWNKNNSSTFVIDKNEEERRYYRADGCYTGPKAPNANTNPNNPKSKIKNTMDTNTFDEKYGKSLVPVSYRDTKSKRLNSDLSAVPEEFKKDVEHLYPFSEIAEAVAQINGGTYDQVRSYLSAVNNTKNEEEYNKLIQLMTLGKEDSSRVVKIEFVGYSSASGTSNRNKELAKNRAYTIERWLSETMGWDVKPGYTAATNPSHGSKGENADDMAEKKYRCAKCTIEFDVTETVKVDETQSQDQYLIDNTRFSPVDKETYKGKQVYQDKDGGRWADMGDKMVKIDNVSYVGDARASIDEGKSVSETNVQKNDKNAYNKYRYDQEYHFYKQMKNDHPFVWQKFTDKLQYFSPAFHSMTPEGFNARLTFLNQCTRQGDTISMSEPNGKTASNMAFGRPPFCVLRIGDFYHQMVVINNININYDVSGGITWDLNEEGVGVQPMICEVNLDFTFIGGGSMEGPIARLQSALTHNFYSNTQLFDNRADRAVYNDNEEHTAGFGELDKNNTYYHNTLR